MPTKVAVAVLSIALAVAAWAAPAAAHQGHASCQASGQFAAAQAQALGADFGTFASSLAQQGQADDFVAGTHAALCE